MDERQRLFFALVPDSDARAAMEDTQARLPGHIGRGVRPENLHLTLAFIGAADADLAGCLQTQAEKVESPAFRFGLDRLGQFARSGVLWLGSGERSEPLLRLVRELNNALEPCGFRPEHRPFAPHVTLMRKVRRRIRLPEVDVIEWKVSEFVLMQSIAIEGGVRYQAVARYPMTAGV